MKYLCTLLVFLCLSSQIESKFNLMKIAQKYSIKNNPKSDNLNNLSFKFQNCGPTSDPFKVNQLQVQPDPLKLPGNITFSGSASIVSNITGPLTVTFIIL